MGGDDLIIEGKRCSARLARRASPGKKLVYERPVKKQIVTIDKGLL
jgi:hypothetical protein